MTRLGKSLLVCTGEKQLVVQVKEGKRLDILDKLMNEAGQVKKYLDIPCLVDCIKQAKLKNEILFAHESSTTLAIRPTLWIYHTSPASTSSVRVIITEYVFKIMKYI